MVLVLGDEWWSCDQCDKRVLQKFKEGHVAFVHEISFKEWLKWHSEAQT